MSEQWLPSVSGNRLTMSHENFDKACRVLIGRELDKPLPDNCLIEILCEAVRLSREHVLAMTQP